MFAPVRHVGADRPGVQATITTSAQYFQNGIPVVHANALTLVMARSGTAHPRAQRWAKTDDTQRHILDAATDAFGTRGLTAATMADVVAASGQPPRRTG